MTATPPRERIALRDFGAIAALCTLAVGVPLWFSAAAGAIGVPSNDDWVYTRAASTLFRTGQVDIPGHTTAFIGQLALVQPFLWLTGGAPWAFLAFGLAMAALGIVSTYLLARRFVGVGSAVATVLLLVAFPGFARQSASFMTDGPAYALIMLCLLLGTRWLQGDGGRATLVASLGVGLLAVSIREFAVAAPLTILVAAWARNRPHDRVWLAALSAILVAGVAGVLVLSGSVSGHAAPSAPKFIRLIGLGSAFTTLAAVLLPALVLRVGQQLRSLRPGLIIVAAALVCVVVLNRNGPLLGNLWTANGLTGDQVLAGARPPVFARIVWSLSGQLALFAGILAAAVALSWGQRRLAHVNSVSTARALVIRIATSREGPLAIFLLGYAMELVLYTYYGSLFDRYLYPMVPVAAILLLRGPIRPLMPGRIQALAQGAFVWLVLSSFIITMNSFAYDTARYREGEAAVAMGYDAQTVDAGYEWVGSHGSGVHKALNPNRLTWWEGMWTSFRPCAVLSNSPLKLAGYKLIRVNRSAYLHFLLFGAREPLYLYGALMAGCPPPPPAVQAP